MPPALPTTKQLQGLYRFHREAVGPRNIFSSLLENRGFVLQNSIKHLSLFKHFGRHSFKTTKATRENFSVRNCGDNKQTMQGNDYKIKIEQVKSFIEKWALIVLVLTPYLFISYKIINSLAQPVTTNNFCGTGYFAAILLHFLLAFVVTIVLALRLFISKKFPLILSIIILVVVIIMPFISYSLF